MVRRKMSVLVARISALLARELELSQALLQQLAEGAVAKVSRPSDKGRS